MVMIFIILAETGISIIIVSFDEEISSNSKPIIISELAAIGYMLIPNFLQKMNTWHVCYIP